MQIILELGAPFDEPTRDEIKALRRAHTPKWTQTKLANLLDVDQSRVSRWEAGTESPAGTTARVLRTLIEQAPHD